jgi:DNA segregation ATPase FtsK/SpoIIIE, S-DNA-T family
VKARAAGIFLIFAAQRPDNLVFPIQMRDQLGNRLILKVQSVGTSEIALGEKGAEKLLGKGHMLARVAGEASPVFAQVPYIDPIESIPPLVEIIRANYEPRSEFA